MSLSRCRGADCTSARPFVIRPKKLRHCASLRRNRDVPPGAWR